MLDIALDVRGFAIFATRKKSVFSRLLGSFATDRPTNFQDILAYVSPAPTGWQLLCNALNKAKAPTGNPVGVVWSCYPDSDCEHPGGVFNIKPIRANVSPAPTG